MVKLICVIFGVPREWFFEMPRSHYCQCCNMPIPESEQQRTLSDGCPASGYRRRAQTARSGAAGGGRAPRGLRFP